LPTLALLRELNRALATAVRMTKELAGNRAFERLAAQDPERFRAADDGPYER
jgi:hypothetical protein